MATTLARIEFRRKTAAQWTSSNEVLLASEPGVETDTGKFKLGDGTTGWSALPYQAPTAASLSATSATLWKANTAYAAGQAVVNPSGFVVTALTGFTSGSSYSAANWSDPTASTYAPFNAKVSYGAKGDGSTDDTAAINAALTAAAAVNSSTQLANSSDSTTLYRHPGVVVPAGKYNVSSQIVVPAGVNLLIDKNAELIATASMTSILYFDKTVLHQGERHEIGILNCNGLAQSGLIAGYVVESSINIGEIFNPTQHGIIVGESGSTAISYAARVHAGRIWRPRAAAPATNYPGYAALYGANLTDSKLDVDSIHGFDIGTKNDGGNNEYIGHPWNATGSAGPSICHDEGAAASGTRLFGYVFDTPGAYGLRVRGGGLITLIAPQFYLNSGATDNTVIGIYCDVTPNLHVHGGGFYSASSSVRWAKDFAQASGTAGKVRWTAYSESTEVVTRAFGERAGFPGIFFTANTNIVPLQVAASNVDAFQLFISSTKAAAITKDGGVTHGNGVTAGGTFYSGSGVPLGTLGNTGDLYHRTDTPSTANQRLYAKTASTTWTAIL